MTVDDKPWYLRRSTWAVASGIAFDLAGVITLAGDLLPKEQAASLLAVGLILGKVATLFARIGGVQAAERVAEKLDAVEKETTGYRWAATEKKPE